MSLCYFFFFFFEIHIEAHWSESINIYRIFSNNKIPVSAKVIKYIYIFYKFHTLFVWSNWFILNPILYSIEANFYRGNKMIKLIIIIIWKYAFRETFAFSKDTKRKRFIDCRFHFCWVLVSVCINRILFTRRCQATWRESATCDTRIRCRRNSTISCSHCCRTSIDNFIRKK